MEYTLQSVLLSISEQIHLLLITVSLTEFLQWDIRAWASLGPEARYLGFGQSQVLGERTEGKSSGKNVPRNPLHKLLENLLNTWHVLTVFIDLIPGRKKIKDRWTPTGLGNSYWGPADSGVFGTNWGVGPARVPQLHPQLLACSRGGSRKQEKRDCKGIKILLGMCPSIYRSKDILP